MSESVPPPTDWGQSAVLWLQAHGLTAMTPQIRASDHYLCAHDPFRYYVERRLGLQSMFTYSEALRHGSWLHKCLELDPFNVNWTLDQWQRALSPHIAARQAELTTVCDTLNIHGDSRKAILRREEEDAHTVATWYSAERRVPIGNGPCFSRFLCNPNIQILGREVGLRIKNPFHADLPPLAGRIDLLYLNRITNELVVLDIKSTSLTTSARLAGCGWEYGTLHYIWLLEESLKAGLIHDRFPDLPTDVRVGGMVHVAFEKPKIRLSNEDRDFVVVEQTVSRGKNKGQVRTEKQFDGLPQFRNYLRRVQDWALAENDYLHLRAERSLDPVINMSWTHARATPQNTKPGVLDPARLRHFQLKHDLIAHYATVEPEPHNFPVDHLSLVDRDSNRHTAWGALAVSSPSQWPTLIRQQRLVTVHREDPLHEPAN